MAGNYLIPSRHGTLLYFRRRVPDDLRPIIGKPYLTKSLGTGLRRQAIILARAYAAHTDDLFYRLRTMSDPKSLADLVSRAKHKLELDALKDNHRDALADQKLAHLQELERQRQEHTRELETLRMKARDVALRAALRSKSEDGSRKAETVGLPLKEAIERYLNEADIKPTTKKTYRSRLPHAVAYFGETGDARHIGQAELAAFARHASNAISNAETANLVITTFAGMLNWYRTTEWGDDELTTKRLLTKKDTPDAEERDAFTLDQLRVLFENARQYRATEPAKYWATVTSAFTGCRIEELAQIELARDLRRDEEADVWYLDLNAKPDSDGVLRKSMKNKSSWRQLPLHSALIQHGFVTYLQRQMENGRTRPFEEQWQPYRESGEGGIKFKWSHYITNWGGRELNKLANNGLIEKGKLSYFHSMRHTFSPVMGNARIDAEVTEAALGHTYARGDRERYMKMKKNPVLLSREGIEPGLTALVALLEAPTPEPLTSP